MRAQQRSRLPVSAPEGTSERKGARTLALQGETENLLSWSLQCPLLHTFSVLQLPRSWYRDININIF